MDGLFHICPGMQRVPFAVLTRGNPAVSSGPAWAVGSRSAAKGQRCLLKWQERAVLGEETRALSPWAMDALRNHGFLSFAELFN